MKEKPRIAVHKFSSCDGCQLAFLNLGEDLLDLAQHVEIVHFAEAGAVEPDAPVDIAFVEGSISTPDERARILAVRANSRQLITIGACATSGGLQALRNHADGAAWLARVYASPEYIDMLGTATPIAAHVTVDFELWGCPVSGAQIAAAVRALLFGVPPVPNGDKVCLECKRSGNLCVLVAHGQPCLGPVTRTGCGALCPRFGRDCYGCYGPSDNLNADALSTRFQGFGLLPDAIARRYRFIHSGQPAFTEAAQRALGEADD